MLNPFPNLFTYMFFAPTLLRLAAAAYLAALANQHRRGAHELRDAVARAAGRSLASPLASLMLVVEAVVAVMLFVGFYTQYAAIAGAVIGFASAVATPHICRPYGRAANWLFFALCLSLLITGAGAFAFDIPL